MLRRGFFTLFLLINVDRFFPFTSVCSWEIKLFDVFVINFALPIVDTAIEDQWFTVNCRITENWSVLQAKKGTGQVKRLTKRKKLVS